MREKRIFRSYLQDDVIDGVDKKNCWFFDAGTKADKLFKIVVLGINLYGIRYLNLLLP